MKTIENDGKPIIYQMSRYTNNVAACIAENRTNKRAMRALGFVVLNPIDHTHYEEIERRQTPRCPKCDSTNVGFWGEIEPGNKQLECIDCHHEFDEKTAIFHPQPDYVWEDLVLVGAMMKGDGGWRCPKCEIEIDPADVAEHNEHHLFPTCCFHYDRGIVGVVLPSAVKISYNGLDWDKIKPIKPILLEWLSKGAKAEYEFMHAHHILVISQQTALSVPWSQWRDFAL